MNSYLGFGFLERPWWRALCEVAALCDGAESGAGDASGTQERLARLSASYASLTAALTADGLSDPAMAIATGLIEGDAPFRLTDGGTPPPGVLRLLDLEFERYASVANRDLSQAAQRAGLSEAPALAELAPRPADGERAEVLRSVAVHLATGAASKARDTYLEILAARGSGPAALNRALRFTDGRLTAVTAPHGASLGDLVGLDEQLEKLVANTEALLERRPAHNTLLYGPRGSGKSTAVRALVERFGAAGLRLVELPVEELRGLAQLLDDLRRRPQSFVLFVDDLGFEDGDAGYRPLRTLLEGGLSGRPANVALYATSNRRHLVKERFADRPDPLDDDVHRWDTHNDKLALADRFGLTLTFPDAGQRRYLVLVRELVARRKLEIEDLDQRAVRFAEWGNGYSGRTARQFIDTLLQSHDAAT